MTGKGIVGHLNAKGCLALQMLSHGKIDEDYLVSSLLQHSANIQQYGLFS